MWLIVETWGEYKVFSQNFGSEILHYQLGMPSCHMHLMKHSALKLKNNCIRDGEPQDHFAPMPYLNGANRTPDKRYLVYTMYMSSRFAAFF